MIRTEPLQRGDVRAELVRNLTRFHDAESWSDAPGSSLWSCCFTAIRTGTVDEARIALIDFTLKLMSEVLPEHEAWLAGAHRTSQSKNRITLYNRLWRRHRHELAEVPEAGRLFDRLHEGPGGIRFAAATRMETVPLAFANDLLTWQHGLIALLPRESGRSVMERVIASKAFARSPWAPSETLEEICHADGCVIEVHGAFDDREVDALARAKKHHIEEATRLLRRR
ncbi:hypothetical protein [Marinimicrococcus flavescens]|uniref:Uncharacterized protein n=1 Tax=Marinimicrococcus flavescens TaxID=3031815 RepID=A0AAP3XSA6_9PROT|nr:hypothetical protein [Marinimicrococcus flavescens]